MTDIYQKTNIFFPARHPNQYLFDPSEAESDISPDCNWCVPLVKDSEFTQSLEIGRGRQLARDILFTQVKFVTQNIGRIFLEPKFKDIVPLWLPSDKDIVIRDPYLNEYPFEGIFLRERGWSVLDAIKLCGYGDTEMYLAPDNELEKLKTLEFVVMGHFLLADYKSGMDNPLLDEVRNLVSKTEGKRLTQDRIFRAITEFPLKNGKKFTTDFVNLPIVIKVNDCKFKMRLSYKDTSGLIAGEPSYFGLCEALGLPTTEKKLLDDNDKEDFLQTTLTKRNKACPYMLYDLNSDILFRKCDELMAEVYREMGLSPYYQRPALTMGATVKNLRVSALCNVLGISPNDLKETNYLIDNFIYPGSAEILKKDASTTKALLAKVEGGRCRNNRPLDIIIYNALDNDIKGCYGEGQRIQLVPMGHPEYIYYPVDSLVNNFMSLEEWLAFYDDGKELVYGGWQARIQTFETLEHDQDFFASWFLDGNSDLNAMAKYITKMKSDTENNETEFNIFDGKLKILNRQIICGVLNADGLDWILNIANPQQRNDLLSKIKILSSMVNRKSNLLERREGETTVQLYQRLKENQAQHQDRNEWSTTVGKGSQKKLIYIDGEYHGWIALNEGELLIDDLLFNRAKHPKKNPDGSKNPKNNTFKGCCNTNFGDLVSPHFRTSNTIIGNNITARGRAMAWYMEKGLNMLFSITDGGCFDINRVCYPKRNQRITGQNSVNAYRHTHNHKSNIRYAPLADCDDISFEWIAFTVTEIKNGKLKQKLKWGCSLVLHQNSFISKLEAYLKHNDDGTSTIVEPGRDWVNQKCLEHLQMLFPDVRVLHEESTSIKAGKEGVEWVKKYIPRKGMFELEMKDFFDVAVSHGSSNYHLINPNDCFLEPHERPLAMRSYEKKKMQAYVLENGNITKSDRYSKQTPPEDFLKQLRENPTKLARQQVFTKQGILKPGDYNNRPTLWQSMGLEPGDSYLKSGLLREFSLSQFTFPTLEMFKAWERQTTKLKNKYGQSFEMFFQNNDRTLNYKKMINEIEELISKYELNPRDTLIKKYGYQKKQLPKNAIHPAFECLIKVKGELGAVEIDLDEIAGELDELDDMV